MIRPRDFKIERARSVRLIWNDEYDFGPKLHDTNFNYHFITSILKSISSLQISFISPHGIAGLWTSGTGNVYTCNVICKTEWHMSFRTQTHSSVANEKKNSPVHSLKRSSSSKIKFNPRRLTYSDISPTLLRLVVPEISIFLRGGGEKDWKCSRCNYTLSISSTFIGQSSSTFIGQILRQKSSFK